MIVFAPYACYLTTLDNIETRPPGRPLTMTDRMSMDVPKANHRSRPTALIALAIALLAGLAPIGDGQADAAESKPTLLGFATGTEWRDDLDAFAREAGRRPAIYQLFRTTESDWSAPTITNILTDLHGRGMTPYIEVTTPDLGALVNGGKDSSLAAMADTIATWINDAPGRRIIIAPLPEMNLVEHPWGGNPSGFKAGYQRIRDTFVARGLTPEQIRFVFGPNGLAGAYDDYYPGDGVVDIIGFSKLNRGTPWRDYEVTFQRHLDQMQAVSVAKPIIITQTASVEDSRRDGWLNDMFSGLKAHDQVIGAIYFNRDVDRDYRVLVNGQLDDAFRRGYATWNPPPDASWIFDGRMDAWVRDRESRLSAGFVDIDGHVFQAAITWLAAEGITKGCNPPLNTQFCPQRPVTRGEMAVFIARALNLPAPVGDHFTDDRGVFYENATNQLFEAGITQGCGPRAFCGGDPITRGQMAAFLARTFNLSPGASDFFRDDGSSVFQRAINSVAHAGITFGCNPPQNDRFCPGDAVTRGQMAAFIMRSDRFR